MNSSAHTIPTVLFPRTLRSLSLRHVRYCLKCMEVYFIVTHHVCRINLPIAKPENPLTGTHRHGLLKLSLSCSHVNKSIFCTPELTFYALQCNSVVCIYYMFWHFEYFNADLLYIAYMFWKFYNAE